MTSERWIGFGLVWLSLAVITGEQLTRRGRVGAEHAQRETAAEPVAYR